MFSFGCMQRQPCKKSVFEYNHMVVKVKWLPRQGTDGVWAGAVVRNFLSIRAVAVCQKWVGYGGKHFFSLFIYFDVYNAVIIQIAC